MPLHDPLLRSFGDNVRRFRERKGYTQEKLGEAAALDPTYVSGIERGVRNPGIRNVARLAKALGVSTSKLVEAYWCSAWRMRPSSDDNHGWPISRKEYTKRCSMKS